MSDVRCPSCGDVFRVPDFALPAGAVAGCPWCKARFTIADLRVALPPLADLLDAEGAALSVRLLPQAADGFARTAAEHAAPQVAPNADNATFAPPDWQAAGPQPVSMDDGPVPSESVSDEVERGSGEALSASVSPAWGHPTAASWEVSDHELEADDSRRSDLETADEPLDLDVSIAQEPRPLQQVTAFEFAEELTGAPRPRGRKPAFPLRSLISIALGGLLALPLAAILLSLIGKPLDLGFWPFLGKQNAHPVATRAGEAVDLDERPRTATGITKPAGRSLAEDMTPQVQPDNAAEQPSASGPPVAASGTGMQEPESEDSLPREATPPTPPTDPSGDSAAMPPGGLELPPGSDAVDARQSRERAAEIAAVPAESNLFPDDHEVLIAGAESEPNSPLAAAGQPKAEAQTAAGATRAVAKPAVEPISPAAQDSAVAAASAKTNGGAVNNKSIQLASPTGRTSDLAEANGSRVQVTPKRSETAKAEPREDAAPRVAAAPDRSISDQVGDVAPLSAPRTIPPPASRAPAPRAPAPVAAQAPEPLTLPAAPATRVEPKAPAVAKPRAGSPQPSRPLSQAMRTELANIETAIQTLVNHREADGTNVLKRRWAELYLAMAKAGEIAAPQDQAELAKLIRQMSDSDLIGPLSMVAANWMQVTNRPSNGVLVVGPVEKKDGKTFIRWRGMVPLEIRGLDPSIESATGPVLILGRIISSDASAPVVEATFAEVEAR